MNNPNVDLPAESILKVHVLKINEGTLEGDLDLGCLNCGRTYHVHVSDDEAVYGYDVTDTTEYVFESITHEGVEGTLAIMTAVPIAPKESGALYRIAMTFPDRDSSAAAVMGSSLKSLLNCGERPVAVRIIDHKVVLDLSD
ncbi:MAG: hypothetical protein NTV39_04180 [Candidatus Saccharibacteria bacterium]|nr:hypothetical protein [Candidatus Saccharibacteria bacterium]